MAGATGGTTRTGRAWRSSCALVLSWARPSALPLALGLALATGCDEGASAGAVRVGPVASALVERARPLPEPPPPPRVEDTFPHLDDEPRDLAWSSGETSHGRLFQGRALRESDALAILPKQRARDLAYGTDDLVALLEHAAVRLHAATKSKLWVGNLGRREGGDIPWSVSHNAGRDADVAFSYLDASGAPIDPPDLVPLGRDGRSKDGKVRFDAARTWTVVRALIDHPTIQVQYLFVSTPLEKMLLDRAKATGEPARVIERAAELLHEPGGSAPHDDHLHVRIRCSRRDVAAGCIDAGPTRPWDRTFPEVRAERVARAAEALRSPTPDVRRRAVLRLALLGAREQADAIAARLADGAAIVRAAAARALGEVGEARHAPALVAQFAAESDGEVLLSILAGAAAIGGSPGGALLADAIAADAGPVAETTEGFALGDLPGGGSLGAPPAKAPIPGSPIGGASSPALWIAPTGSPFASFAEGAPPIDRVALRDVAIALAGRADASEPAVPLAALVVATKGDLRTRAAAALEEVTNRRVVDFADPARSEAELEAGAARWAAVVKALGKSPRDVWIATGFLASGYQAPSLEKKHAWELVRAVAGPTFTSQAARRWLARMEGAEPGLHWSAGEACRHWMSWFGERHRRYRIEKAPEPVKRACWGAER